MTEDAARQAIEDAIRFHVSVESAYYGDGHYVDGIADAVLGVIEGLEQAGYKIVRRDGYDAL